MFSTWSGSTGESKSKDTTTSKDSSVFSSMMWTSKPKEKETTNSDDSTTWMFCSSWWGSSTEEEKNSKSENTTTSKDTTEPMFCSWCIPEEETKTKDPPKAARPFTPLWASKTTEKEQEPEQPEKRSRRKRLLVALLLCFLLALLIGLLLGRFLWDWGRDSDPPSPKSTNIISSEPDPSNATVPTVPTIITPALTVGVFYYPWYTNNFNDGLEYLRQELDTDQEPTLGEYDDTDPAVMAQHLAWSRQANIRLWVTSWWGADSPEDDTIQNVILAHEELQDHKIALFYETNGRILESEDFATDRVIPDMQYICNEYFDHPNYLRIDGRPVLVVYVTRSLQGKGLLESVIQLMRETASDMGHDVYIVGDHVYKQAPTVVTSGSYPAFDLLDAVTNYDVYGSMGVYGGYAGMEGVTEQYDNMRDWRNLSQAQDCAFIPSIAPGFNKLGSRNGPLARKLTPDAAPGSLFRASLEQARTLVEPSTENLLLVNSFNEWHQDTQIEPVSGTSTTEPEDVTYGFEYDGYGELYLDILREATTEEEDV